MLTSRQFYPAAKILRKDENPLNVQRLCGMGTAPLPVFVTGAVPAAAPDRCMQLLQETLLLLPASRAEQSLPLDLSRDEQLYNGSRERFRLLQN